MDSDINLGVLTCLRRRGTCTHTCQSLCQCDCIHLFLFSDTSVMQSISTFIISVQFNSVTQSCPILCNPMNRSMPGLPIHHQLLEFTQTHVHRLKLMPSSHFILCRPLLLLPPIPPSIRDFSNESTRRMRWPKYWSFSLSISPSNEHPGLVSFRMDWLDLLAVQWTLKSLLQHHSSKASSHLVHYFVFTFSALSSNF